MYNKFGKHTIIDVKGCPIDLIDSKENIANFVTELCDKINMHPYGIPLIVRFGDDPKVEGYSLVQLIYTSNICGHFCPYNYEMEVNGQKINNAGSAYLDIFSCQDYDSNLALSVVKQYFQYTSYEMKIFDRV